jgi:hypothetical protein
MSRGADVITLLLRLRSEVAAAEFLASAERLSRLLKANFNPNQPRVPAGNPDGGQWTSTGGSTSASSRAGAGDGPSGTGEPLKITIRPRAREDGKRPPELPPAIPSVRPATRRLEHRIARQTIGWLARVALRGMTGPVGTVMTVIEATVWLHEHLPNMQSYLDPPKTLRELRDAVREPKKGYDTHHIVEQGSAAEYGFPRSVIDAPENLVRIPRYKHWEINAWYETKNEEFGWRTPRVYLQDKDWSERARVGLSVLTKYGVLKP